MTLQPAQAMVTSNATPLMQHARAARCLVNGCQNSQAAARFLLIDVLGNTLVFLPIGFSVSGLLGKWRHWQRLLFVSVLGAALSLSIETLQMAVPGRASDVDDLLFNTLGTAAGAALFVLVHRAEADTNGDIL